MPEGHLLHRLARDQAELVGRIVSVALPPAERATAAEADARMVYKQANCGACGAPVESWSLDGRTAYACPNCQPR